MDVNQRQVAGDRVALLPTGVMRFFEQPEADITL
jgi:hypothetical protein